MRKSYSVCPTKKMMARMLRLWAFDLGDDINKLDNLPFYAYRVSCGDTVLAPFDEYEQFPTFQTVISKSGNRTVRIIFEHPYEQGNESEALMDRLVDLGCGFEGANAKLFAVNIPPTVDLNAVAGQLIDADVTWEYADPTYEDLYPDEQ